MAGYTVMYKNSQKQPRLLYLLCLSEMLERFSYYAMRAILVLYMAKILLFSPNRSFGIFAGFSALLYLAPFLGGFLADKILGAKRAIILGGILLTAGYSLLARSGTEFFYDGLALVAIGSGFFIPNIAAIVGQLYDNNETGRDSGFSIFYAAINLGALIPPIIITAIIMKFGWNTGFVIAALCVLIGTLFFYFGLMNFPELGRLAAPAPENKLQFYSFSIIAAIFLIPLFSELIRRPQLANIIVFMMGGLFLIYAFYESCKYSKVQRSKLHVCFFLTLFSIIFEVLLQQTGMSMTIFVENNVQRNFKYWEIPTIMFQALNPFFIVLLAPVFSKMWEWLGEKKLNPSIPAKFAWGTLLMGLGFAIFPFAISHSNSDQISFAWIIVSYLIQSCGELLVSPVGLSMITGMSPKSMTGIMMGVWCFAIAIANLLAGMISQRSIVPVDVNISMGSAHAYSNIFGELGGISIVASLLIFTMIPKMKTILTHKNYENEITDSAISNLDLSSS